MKIEIEIPDGYKITNNNFIGKHDNKTVYCVGLKKEIVKDFNFYVETHLYVRYSKEERYVKKLEFEQKKYDNISLADRISLLKSIIEEFENVDNSDRNLLLSLTSEFNSPLYQKLKNICPIEFLKTFE